jgi:hypothetical protein
VHFLIPTYESQIKSDVRNANYCIREKIEILCANDLKIGPASEKIRKFVKMQFHEF